jgi:adenosylcobinamide-GDP ribazoletransferase
VLVATALGALAALAVAALPGAVRGGLTGLGPYALAPVAAWTVALLLGRYVLTKLPGQTGDTYGATGEAVETAILLLFALRFWGTP